MPNRLAAENTGTLLLMPIVYLLLQYIGKMDNIQTV